MLGNSEHLESWIFSERENIIIPKYSVGMSVTINIIDSSSIWFELHGHTCIIRDVIEYELWGSNWVGYFLDWRVEDNPARECNFDMAKVLWREEHFIPIQEGE